MYVAVNRKCCLPTANVPVIFVLINKNRYLPPLIFRFNLIQYNLRKDDALNDI